MKKLTYLTVIGSLIATTALACPEGKEHSKPCPMMKDGICLKTKNHDGHGEHGGHSMPTTHSTMASNPAIAAYIKGMDIMHRDMAITYTGNTDYDFLAGMIPHHQGAVDMAQVVMQYGQNPQVRRLAAEIIRSQNLEIKWMRQYMKQLEAKGIKPLPHNAKANPPFNETKWVGSKNHFWQ
jgi:hypothetical protein